MAKTADDSKDVRPCTPAIAVALEAEMLLFLLSDCSNFELQVYSHSEIISQIGVQVLHWP